jgi:hypothetical protein
VIEPWWKALHSLALKGKHFGTWTAIEQAIAAATTAWNAHQQPCAWGAGVASGSPPRRSRCPPKVT